MVLVAKRADHGWANDPVQVLAERGLTPSAREVSMSNAAESAAAERRKPCLLALLFCDWANQTDDAKANLSGVFDRINVPTLPHQSPPFFIYLRTADILSGSLEIVHLAPDGRETGRLEFEVSATKRDPQELVVSEIVVRTQVQLETVGAHWIEVAIKGPHWAKRR